MFMETGPRRRAKPLPSISRKDLKTHISCVIYPFIRVYWYIHSAPSLFTGPRPCGKHSIHREPAGLNRKISVVWVLINSLWDKDLWQADLLGYIPRKNGSESWIVGPGREEATQACDSKQSLSEGKFGLMQGVLETVQFTSQNCPYEGMRDLEDLYPLYPSVHKPSQGH